MSITFHTADVKFSLKEKNKLKAFIHSQVLKFSDFQIVELSFVFCSDEYLRTINKKFLNHDYYTDIITFPLSENEHTLEGEIYISIERVKENSDKFKVVSGKSKGRLQTQNSKLSTQHFSIELHRVMFHGVLHLLGYRDKTKAQKAEMRNMEEKWINKFKDQSSKNKE